MAPHSVAAQVATDRQERYLQGLRDELAGYEGNPNKTDRAKQVAAEIRRVSGNAGKTPRERQQPPVETAAAAGEAKPKGRRLSKSKDGDDSAVHVDPGDDDTGA